MTQHKDGQPRESGITPEQQAEIDRIKRRNMLLAAIAGIVMLVLGFLAGQEARERKSGALEVAPAGVVFEVCAAEFALAGQAAA